MTDTTQPREQAGDHTVYSVLKSIIEDGYLSETKAARAQIVLTRQAAPEAPTAWIADVIRDVAELPDRDSPADQPDMMLVSADELRVIIERRASTGAAPEAPGSEQQPAPSLIELESKVAAARADATLFNDEAMRLRRVVRALGMEREVPEDDATLRGSLFAVLGQIAYKLERATTAATTASASSQKCQYPNCGCTSRVACNFNYDRATAPSSNAAPLDKAVEKEKFIAWGQRFHRNARSYTARDFDHGLIAWLAAKSDAAMSAATEQEPK